MKVGQLITSLQAWSPVCHSTKLWLDWAHNGAQSTDPFQIDNAQPQTPDVSFLPIAMRKKLSALNKVGLYLIHHTLNDQQRTSIPIVMSSRFGEVNTMVELLNLIAENQASSPMTFSRSVHNATVGIFSIAANNQSANVALSAMQHSFAAGLLEALLQLFDRPIGEQLLYSYADEAIPTIFEAFVTEPPVNYGVAFVLQRNETSPTLRELHEELSGCECLDFMKRLLLDSEVAKRLLTYS